MNFKKLIIVLVIVLITLGATACDKDSSMNEQTRNEKLTMEEQAWKEAVNYIYWFSDKNDANLKPGIYTEERVVKNYDLNYTCCVAITTSEGIYDQWYITVEKKANGDWDVIEIE